MATGFPGKFCSTLRGRTIRRNHSSRTQFAKEGSQSRLKGRRFNSVIPSHKTDLLNSSILGVMMAPIKSPVVNKSYQFLQSRDPPLLKISK